MKEEEKVEFVVELCGVIRKEKVTKTENLRLTSELGERNQR